MIMISKCHYRGSFPLKKTNNRISDINAVVPKRQVITSISVFEKPTYYYTIEIRSILCMRLDNRVTFPCINSTEENALDPWLSYIDISYVYSETASIFK
jgi:hypothetical protein